MAFHLGINTGFAVNRYAEPEVWARIVGEELGLKFVQFTADMLNPSLPKPIVAAQLKRIKEACRRYGITVCGTFTGAFTRVNHLSHPDEEIRRYWISWFKDFADMSAELGAESMGSHFGIQTLADDRDPDRRRARMRQNIEGWHEIAAHAKTRGLKYLAWEPMSIRREYGETLESARALQEAVNAGSPLPFFTCIDVDHGDVSSANPADTDPYAWLAAFAKDSPLIHLKQSTRNKGGHWPFIEPYNSEGKIVGAKVARTLKDNGRDEAYLLLEFSFREREPADSTVIDALKASVAYWRKELSAA